jgi:hypothetical protein
MACATIMHGSHQEVSISSTPSGASITVDGQERGKTPIAVDLRRKEKSLIKITHDGYLPFETYLTKKTSGWVVGNLIFGGLPGLIVDALTGGLYLLRPEEIAPVLVKAAAAESVPGAASRTQQQERAVQSVVRPPSDPPDPTGGGDAGSVRLRSSRVKIVTDPVGAEVFLGGTSLGKASLAGVLVDLPNGKSVFRVEMPGYESAEKRVSVDQQLSNEEGEAIVIVVRLVHHVPPEPPQSAQSQGATGGPPTLAADEVPAVTLLGLLQSEDRKAREKAVTGLGKPGPHAKESVPALVGALRDRSWQVRLSAAEALGRIGPDAHLAVPALLETTRDRHLATSIKASRAIERIGPSALPALTEAAKSPDPKIRKEATNLATKIRERQAR